MKKHYFNSDPADPSKFVHICTLWFFSNISFHQIWQTYNKRFAEIEHHGNSCLLVIYILHNTTAHVGCMSLAYRSSYMTLIKSMRNHLVFPLNWSHTILLMLFTCIYRLEHETQIGQFADDSMQETHCIQVLYNYVLPTHDNDNEWQWK